MNELEKNKTKRDDLFNSDLVYEISRLAGFEINQDDITDERIRMRLESLPVKENGIRCYMLSPFEIELFVSLQEIRRKAGAGVVLRSIEEIFKYPEAVKEYLKHFETEETLTQSDKQKTLGTITNK